MTATIVTWHHSEPRFIQRAQVELNVNMNNLQEAVMDFQGRTGDSMCLKAVLVKGVSPDMVTRH